VVVEAYDQLLAEGYLVTRRGSGTSVADVPAGAAPPQRPTVPNPAPAVLDLWPGTPDLTRFPRARWATAVRRAVTEVPAHRLGYGDPRRVTR
jgi:GntR family transcriptional regulator/MocR family aminotransferase